MYFKTSDELQATYTIHCEGYNDFSRTLNNNTLSGYTTNHEYLLVGAIPGQINTITVTLTNKQGNPVDTLSWSYNAPSLQGGDQYLTVDCDDANTSSLSNGLYTVLGNDVTEDSEEQAYMRLYDTTAFSVVKFQLFLIVVIVFYLKIIQCTLVFLVQRSLVWIKQVIFLEFMIQVIINYIMIISSMTIIIFLFLQVRKTQRQVKIKLL